MSEIVSMNEAMPGRWYQLSTWAKHGSEHKTKKFVFCNVDEAVAAYHNVKVRAEKVNAERSDIKCGCNLYVCIDGKIDFVESFRLFSDRLYEDAVLPVAK